MICCYLERGYRLNQVDFSQEEDYKDYLIFLQVFGKDDSHCWVFAETHSHL